MYLSSETSTSRSKMRQYDCQKSHVTLGVTITPSLKMKDAGVKIFHVGGKFGLGLVASLLTKYDTWIAYFSVGLPSITYTLPVSHHNRKAMAKIQMIPTKTTLLKLGFNRNTSQKIVFGLQYYLGLGIWHLYVEQGIA